MGKADEDDDKNKESFFSQHSENPFSVQEGHFLVCVLPGFGNFGDFKTERLLVDEEDCPFFLTGSITSFFFLKKHCASHIYTCVCIYG